MRRGLTKLIGLLLLTKLLRVVLPAMARLALEVMRLPKLITLVVIVLRHCPSSCLYRYLRYRPQSIGQHATPQEIGKYANYTTDTASDKNDE